MCLVLYRLEKEATGAMLQRDDFLVPAEQIHTLTVRSSHHNHQSLDSKPNFVNCRLWYTSTL